MDIDSNGHMTKSATAPALPSAPANQVAWDNWAKSVVAVMKKRTAEDFDDLSKAVGEIVGKEIVEFTAKTDDWKRDVFQQLTEGLHGTVNAAVRNSRTDMLRRFGEQQAHIDRLEIEIAKMRAEREYKP